MNAITAPAPGNPERSRFSVALLFSLLLHAILILGIGFHFAQPEPGVPTLDVTLINTSNAEKPAKADYLAQADNAGGGNSDKAHRPGAPFSGPLPVPQAGVTPVPLTPAAPAEQAESGPHILATTGRTHDTVARQQNTRAEPHSAERASPIPVPQQVEMARLAQEVRDEQEAYARRPRRKYISANTRSTADAAYQVAWVRRIERIGNLNYPSAARRRHLHGNVVLSVTLGTEGQVRGVRINASSGHRVLDDAAIRIVHLAAPFPAIPPDKDAGGHRITELVITRTWQFLPGARLKTRATDSQ
ncbi:MAG: energy transducer TonB [Rhodanobacteraceae bacterium]